MHRLDSIVFTNLPIDTLWNIYDPNIRKISACFFFANLLNRCNQLRVAPVFHVVVALYLKVLVIEESITIPCHAER